MQEIPAGFWTAKVPAKFFADHYDRCSETQPCCKPMEWGKRFVKVYGVRADWENLRSDAEYYASDNDYVELRASAKATLRYLPF